MNDLNHEEMRSTRSLQELLETSLPVYHDDIESLQVLAHQWKRIEGDFDDFRDSLENIHEVIVKPLETLNLIKEKQERLQRLDHLLSRVLKERDTLEAIDRAEEEGRFLDAAQLISGLGCADPSGSDLADSVGISSSGT